MQGSTTEGGSGCRPKRVKHNPIEPSFHEWKKLSMNDYISACDDYNPYVHLKTSSDPRFFARIQNEIYDSLIDSLQFHVVEQSWFDLEFLHTDYPDAMEVLTFHGLDKLMGLKVNYSPELIKEFFATMYFHKDEEKTMTWMSAGTVCSKNLTHFATLLELEVPDVEDNHYHCIHDARKGVLGYHPTLHMDYPEGHGSLDAPSVTKMSSKYHFSTRFFATLLLFDKEIRVIFMGGL
jgi:hypothetical protein